MAVKDKMFFTFDARLGRIMDHDCRVYAISEDTLVVINYVGTFLYRIPNLSAVSPNSDLDTELF